MTDSQSNQPVDRRRADPLQVAADMIDQEQGDTASSPAAASTPDAGQDRHEVPSRGDEPAGSDDNSPRARRAAARAARQAAADKRRAERAAAKSFAASRRQSTPASESSDDTRQPAAEAPVEQTLAQKLDAAR